MPYGIDDIIREDSRIRVEPDEFWFKVNDANEVSFSPFKISKRVPELVGLGEKPPSPAEVVQYLKDTPDASMECDGLYAERRIWNQTDSESIVLPAGVYTYAESAGGRFPERLIETKLRTDRHVSLGNSYAVLEKDVQNFLNSEKIYRDHGFIYKMGALLWGSPGNSKTYHVRKILNQISQQEAIIIFIQEKFPSTFFLHKVQNSLKNRLKVFVFEELAATLDNWNTSRILDFLDGETSCDRSVVLATTNYPEKIPGNMVNRPSRFDKVIKFEVPGAEDRSTLIEHFLDRKPDRLELEACKDFSVAEVREICLEVLIKKVEFLTAVDVLKKRNLLSRKSFAANKDVGF